ncbi:hypothetical protein K440DRAFT_643331 [Wilcoxina mikolae CBS 423.85]|nr:hypothetical protein K440DRAFT_643331 [Wilcoxina mikolae CBS 423.85]
MSSDHPPPRGPLSSRKSVFTDRCSLHPSLGHSQLPEIPGGPFPPKSKKEAYFYAREASSYPSCFTISGTLRESVKSKIDNPVAGEETTEPPSSPKKEIDSAAVQQSVKHFQELYGVKKIRDDYVSMSDSDEDEIFNFINSINKKPVLKGKTGRQEVELPEWKSKNPGSVLEKLNTMSGIKSTYDMMRERRKTVGVMDHSLDGGPEWKSKNAGAISGKSNINSHIKSTCDMVSERRKTVSAMADSWVDIHTVRCSGSPDATWEFIEDEVEHPEVEVPEWCFSTTTRKQGTKSNLASPSNTVKEERRKTITTMVHHPTGEVSLHGLGEEGKAVEVPEWCFSTTTTNDATKSNPAPPSSTVKERHKTIRTMARQPTGEVNLHGHGQENTFNTARDSNIRIREVELRGSRPGDYTTKKLPIKNDFHNAPNISKESGKTANSIAHPKARRSSIPVPGDKLENLPEHREFRSATTKNEFDSSSTIPRPKPVGALATVRQSDKRSNLPVPHKKANSANDITGRGSKNNRNDNELTTKGHRKTVSHLPRLSQLSHATGKSNDSRTSGPENRGNGATRGEPKHPPSAAKERRKTLSMASHEHSSNSNQPGIEPKHGASTAKGHCKTASTASHGPSNPFVRPGVEPQPFLRTPNPRDVVSDKKVQDFLLNLKRQADTVSFTTSPAKKTKETKEEAEEPFHSPDSITNKKVPRFLLNLKRQADTVTFINAQVEETKEEVTASAKEVKEEEESEDEEPFEFEEWLSKNTTTVAQDLQMQAERLEKLEEFFTARVGAEENKERLEDIRRRWTVGEK